MIKVTLLGSGNVAQHLTAAFAASKQVQLCEIYARSVPDFDVPANTVIVNKIEDLNESDLYIIAVSDSAISEISNQLDFQGKLVVHTSGSIPLITLNPKNKRGVFYPLQTFSKQKQVDFKSVPLCLESEFEADYKILETVAHSLSNSIYKINSNQRKALHVAAVFANNFTNHLYAQAADICKANNVPFDILRPLIEETGSKIQTLSPLEAQTGPAIRNDENTIKAHLDFLTDKNQHEIYTLLTKSIRNGRKL